jgi:hypothetical protein
MSVSVHLSSNFEPIIARVQRAPSAQNSNSAHYGELVRGIADAALATMPPGFESITLARIGEPLRRGARVWPEEESPHPADFLSRVGTLAWTRP